MYLGRENKKTTWTWAAEKILISINYYYYLNIIIHVFIYLPNK